MTNDTDMGLTNYLFTQNIGRAFRVAGALQSGTVAVNTANPNPPESPFGGIKEERIWERGGTGPRCQGVLLNEGYHPDFVVCGSCPEVC